jgi:hypothetical protein
MEAAATGTWVSVEELDVVVVDVDVAEGVDVDVDVDVDVPAVLEEPLPHPVNVALANIAVMPRT